MHNKSIAILVFLLFFSCQKSYLTVQQHWIDIRYLASSSIYAPDPEQKDPPMGNKILIGWDFPLSVYKKKPFLIFTARLWDQTQSSYRYEVDRKRGYKTLYFSEKDPKKKLLTYKIDIEDEMGNSLEVWEHQFWTKQILSEETFSSNNACNFNTSS